MLIRDRLQCATENASLPLKEWNDDGYFMSYFRQQISH